MKPTGGILYDTGSSDDDDEIRIRLESSSDYSSDFPGEYAEPSIQATLESTIKTCSATTSPIAVSDTDHVGDKKKTKSHFYHVLDVSFLYQIIFAVVGCMCACFFYFY